MQVRSEAHPEVPGSREVLPVFMEGHGHDPVCGVEGLFHSIPMVNVYINVQHPLVVPRREAHRQTWDQYKHNTVFSRETTCESETLLLL